jgi:hypothetical protein
MAKKSPFAHLLTIEQVREISERLMCHGDNQTIITFLLLLRALTYSDDRETLLCAAEFGVMPYIRETNDALDEAISLRLDALRKDGRR